MRSFKQIDFAVQVAVIIFSLVFVLTQTVQFYTVYLLVGGFQFTSIIIHELTQSFTAKGTSRRWYHNIVYFVVALMALSVLIDAFLIIFLPMLFVAPIMAIYYIRLCYKESFIYSKRPLSILK